MGRNNEYYPSPTDYVLPWSNQQDKIQIVGHGQNSTGFLINDKQIGVLHGQYNTHEAAHKSAQRQQTAERTIAGSMGHRGVRSEFIITAAQKPEEGYGIVRVKPLVSGEETSRLKLVELISNSHITSGMAELMRLSLQTFWKTGYIPNLVGHNPDRSILEFIRNRLPYRSGNIVVEHLTGEPKLIDCEAKAEEWHWPSTKSVTQKLRIIGSLMGISLSLGIFTTATKLHQLRNSFVREPIVQESSSALENRLGSLISLLESRKVDYRVLGSVAIASLTNSPLSSKRPDGSYRDIDIVILDKPNKELYETISKLNADKTKPQISPHFLDPHEEFVNHKVGRLFPSYLTHLTRDNHGEIHMVYGQTSIDLGKNFTLVRTTLGNTKFLTVDLPTMLGLYITRTGYYRIEDQNKIRNLYRQYGPIVIPEKYLRMSTMIRKENPKEYSNQVMRDSLNYWTNNLFSRLLDAAKMEHTG